MMVFEQSIMSGLLKPSEMYISRRIRFHLHHEAFEVHLAVL